LGWRCCPTVWQAQCDSACRIAFDVVRNGDRNGDRSWRGGALHDCNARRHGDVNLRRDRQHAALPPPRALHRDGLHGATYREAPAFDFITEDADEIRRREWQMEV